MNLSTSEAPKSSPWRTNRTTGRAYRVDESDLIPRHKRYRLPTRFHRESLWDWVARQNTAAAQLNTPDTKAAQLVRHYGTRRLYFYSLSARELGVIDPERVGWLEAPEHYDRLEVIEAWQRLLDAAFPNAPCKWAIHIGRDNRVALHIIAGAEHNIPNLNDDPEHRKLVKDTFGDRRRVFAYATSKSHPTYRQVAAYEKAAAAAGGVRRLPQHSGFRGMEFAQSTPENDVLHGSLKRVHKVMDFERNTQEPTAPEGLGRWLSGTLGTVTRLVSTSTSPPARGTI